MKTLVRDNVGDGFHVLNYREASGTSPKGAGKTEVFSGKNI
jgi:hypothetical protein